MGYSADNISVKLELANGTEPMIIDKFPCIMSSVNNGRFAGGELYLCPCALLNDGLLDVCMLTRTPNFLGVL